jgi:hypothetical protein
MVPPSRRSLAIVPQFWETMIRMSQTDCRVFQAICGLVLVLAAGCCGNSPSHKCDFTPPDIPGNDAGTDGPLACGNEICEGGKVCCLKKAPPVAFCINPLDFVNQGCEKQDLPCFKSTDCPGGLSCCLVFSGTGDNIGGTVTCRQSLLCPGDGVMTLIACETSDECPATRPACTFLTSTPKGDFNVCQ